MSKNLIFGIVYFLVTSLLVEQWDKRRKTKDENIKRLAGVFSQVALNEEVERKKRSKIELEKEYLQKQENLKKIPLWKRKGYSSNTEYLAEKERSIRKREQDILLAKSYKQRRRKSKLKTNLLNIDHLMELTPIEFEKWVKQNVFEKEGWNVEETKTTGDGGIDLVLRRTGEHAIAQCKRFRTTVGEPALRDFYGTMMSEGVSRGYFVTTGLFSLSAQKFAQDKPIIMLDRRLLAQKLE